MCKHWKKNIVTTLGRRIWFYHEIDTLFMLTDSSECWLKNKLEEFNLIKKLLYYYRLKPQTYKAHPKYAKENLLKKKQTNKPHHTNKTNQSIKKSTPKPKNNTIQPPRPEIPSLLKFKSQKVLNAKCKVIVQNLWLLTRL